MQIDGEEQNTTDINVPFVIGNEAKPAAESADQKTANAKAAAKPKKEAAAKVDKEAPAKKPAAKKPAPDKGKDQKK